MRAPYLYKFHSEILIATGGIILIALSFLADAVGNQAGFGGKQLLLAIFGGGLVLTATSMSGARWVRSLAYSKQWIVLAAVGLGLRLLIMPLLVDPDLLIMQFSARSLAYDGTIVGNTLYPDQLVYPLPIYILMAGLQALFKPLMPHYNTMSGVCDGALLQWINTWGRSYLLPWLSGWFCTPDRFLYIFLLKIHYLPFDIGCAFLLTRWGDDHQKRLRLFGFWMLNPILLYAVYAWGQFDIIPTFFVLLSLHYARKGNPVWAAFWLGIGASFKSYPLLILPFLILFVKGFWKRVKVVLAGGLPYAIGILPYFFIPSIAQSNVFLPAGAGAEHSAVLGFGHEQRLFDAALSIGYERVIYVFFVIYGILLLHAYWHSRTNPQPLEQLWKYEFAVLMFMFSLIIFHPYWLVWLIPLVGFYWTSDRLGKYFPYGVWLLLCAGIVLWHFGSKTILMLTPTLPQVVNSPDPHRLISEMFPTLLSKTEMAVDVLRSLLLALAIGLSWLSLNGLNLRFDQVNSSEQDVI
jgi:hypothetical protein